jgi:hypothetical protein
MTRIRIIGLALVAVFAVSAVAAASASAAPKFEATAYPATVEAKGTNIQKFKVESGTSECEESAFKGEATGASEWLKVLPEYKKCSFIPVGKGLEIAEVNMNGCEYEFHVTAEIAGKPEHFEGTVDIINNGAKSCAAEPITVKAAGCLVKVGPQVGLKRVEYVDVNGKTEVEVNANVTGIAYEEEKGCPASPLKNEKRVNGAYEGKALAKGFNKLKVQQAIWVK